MAFSEGNDDDDNDDDDDDDDNDDGDTSFQESESATTVASTRNTQAASKSASDEAPASKKTADDKKVPDLESIVAGSLYQTDEERSIRDQRNARAGQSELLSKNKEAYSARVHNRQQKRAADWRARRSMMAFSEGNDDDDDNISVQESESANTEPNPRLFRERRKASSVFDKSFRQQQWNEEEESESENSDDGADKETLNTSSDVGDLFDILARFDDNTQGGEGDEKEPLFKMIKRGPSGLLLSQRHSERFITAPSDGNETGESNEQGLVESDEHNDSKVAYERHHGGANRGRAGGRARGRGSGSGRGRGKGKGKGNRPRPRPPRRAQGETETNAAPP